MPTPQRIANAYKSAQAHRDLPHLLDKYETPNRNDYAATEKQKSFHDVLAQGLQRRERK